MALETCLEIADIHVSPKFGSHSVEKSTQSSLSYSVRYFPGCSESFTESYSNVSSLRKRSCYTRKIKSTQLHQLTKRCQSHHYRNHLPVQFFPFAIVRKLATPLSKKLQWSPGNHAPGYRLRSGERGRKRANVTRLKTPPPLSPTQAMSRAAHLPRKIEAGAWNGSPGSLDNQTMVDLDQERKDLLMNPGGEGGKIVQKTGGKMGKDHSEPIFTYILSEQIKNYQKSIISFIPSVNSLAFSLSGFEQLWFSFQAGTTYTSTQQNWGRASFFVCLKSDQGQ